MKKILSIILVLVAVTCFFSCKENETIVEHLYYGVDYSQIDGEQSYVLSFVDEMNAAISQYTGHVDVESKLINTFRLVCEKYNTGKLNGTVILCRSDKVESGRLVDPITVAEFEFR
ncbi:MAG: hypothetical protein KBS95_01925 [Alistipes sp.]|nr:hypothetical protein [Candidatus Alistipes equi]